MHLSLSFPREVRGCRWGNWGLCGDFATHLCPCGGGNEGSFLYHTLYVPQPGEICGSSFRYLEDGKPVEWRC